MRPATRRLAAMIGGALMLALPAATAAAAPCGNTAAGFPAWVQSFKQEAARQGFSQRTIDAAFNGVTYQTKTISLDRNQRSFRLSFDQFMQKRGASTIVSRGRQLKQQYASLFNSLERRYGVPPGPLLAIWGMETGFGRFMGNTTAIPALATLAYDCRRSDFFRRELYAALQIVERGVMSPGQMRSAGHGELGQTQFLPSNYVRFGVDGDGNGRVDMIRSTADALASTANYLRAHGWRPGAGYQPGQPNFRAIQEWNAAGVYQKAIAAIAADIDG